MSPSRPFIMRPVATSLLHGGHPAGRPRRVQLPAALGPAGGRLPDHPGQTFYPGASPEVMADDGHRPARAAVRRDDRPEPHVVDQLGGRLGDHPAVQPRPRPRRGRAGGAGGDQRGRQPAAGRPARAADLRQGQPGRRADHDPGADLQHHAADPGRGPGRIAAGPEDLRRSQGVGLVDVIAAASGRRCASRSTPRRWPTTASAWRRCARRSARPTPTRPRARSTDRPAPTPSTPTTSSPPRTTT